MTRPIGSGRDVTGGKREDVSTILSSQATSGAYPASPSYAQYPYSWLRDGAFIAHAMDRVGEYDSSRQFHDWVADCLLRYRAEIETVIDRGQRGETMDIKETEFPPIRFTVQGQWLQDGWSNYQLDGYGQWLWSLVEHLERTGDEPAPRIREAAALAASYVATFYQEPCFDAWEEHRSQIHTATLASIQGGLASVSRSLLPEFAEPAQEVRRMILAECVEDGHFVKHIGNSAVDASLLWLSTPLSVVEEDDPLMLATVAEIERTLVHGAGVRRYQADTFYGGGEWILLTAWLGWYYARRGETVRASGLLTWIEAQRDEDGYLPEQVPGRKTVRRFLEYWTARWGTPARPLLWSHAMTIILREELANDSQAVDAQPDG